MSNQQVPQHNNLWLGGVEKDKINKLKDSWVKHEIKMDTNGPKVVRSLNELGKLGAILTEKQPHPRQRKKQQAYKAGDDNALEE
jgi:hypothetical protein